MSRSSLSAPSLAVWAKSAAHGGAVSLVQHLEDSAAVAGLLARDWLAPLVLARVDAELPDAGDAERMLTWLAGVHDIGKASTGFACADRQGAGDLTAAGLSVRHATDVISRQPRHDIAGQAVLVDWLTDRGMSPRAARSQVVPVGGHHGRFADDGAEEAARERLACHSAWSPVRDQLLDHIAVTVGTDGRLVAWQGVRLSPAAQMLLTGAVVVSDWIASNEQLFPREEDEAVAARAAKGWSALRLPASWRPTPATDSSEALFTQRTALPAGASPRPAQLAAVEHARSVRPGLAVLELGTGSGKTETALVIAEDWAARTGANGLLFCLPTRATSNSMFARVQTWLARQDREAGSLSTYLAHGKAGLDSTWQGLTTTAPSGLGDPYDPGADEEVAVAHAWLSGSKKGLLSSMVVGTIDQLLFAALNSRYVPLRHLAIAGKVVVLDEVHAADDYMRVYLHRALEWLGAYGTPVVVLTATLPTAQREALLMAYEKGAQQQVLPAEPAPSYPRLSTTGTSGRAAITLPGDGRSTAVRLDRGEDDDKAVVRLVAELRPDDGVVLVIRNTVGRAQATYRALRRSLPADEVLLLHSRLYVADRADREQRLMHLLGPDGERPRRLVVVGTQVVEQSLDIDADLLLTDLAPVDLVLQRIGRLHRHPRARPAGLTEARCVLLGADWASTPPEPVRGSITVYGLAGLLRAAWVLTPYLDGRDLVLPDHLDDLVQSAYGDVLPVASAWETALAEADRQEAHEQAERQARALTFLLRGPHEKPLLVGLNRAGSGADEDSPTGQAAVRDGVGGVEVLLLARDGDGLRLPTWSGPAPRAMSLSTVPDDATARAALRCTVPVPEWVRQRACRELDALVPLAWRGSRWLRGLPVVPLDDSGVGRIGPVAVRYDDEEGLVIG